MPDPIDPPRPGTPAPELRGLDPGELLERGLQTVKASAGAGGWEPPTPEELARLLPQYRIESLLGRGGMGAVYKGVQAALDRPVAIKLLPSELAADADFIARFQREARTLARLQHSGIVAVHDFGQTSAGHLYFVMEFVDGTDLQRILKGPGLKPEQVFELIAQICDALHYAHRQGVIHRDIKPANILLTQDGRAKVADFGLARPLTEESGGLTMTNMVMGTPDYMAPEQRTGAGHPDHRADIFALGVMLYEMLTGQRPHGAFQPASQRVQVDVRIDQVVLKALQQEPDRRYQQASEMKTDVDRIRTTPPGPPASTPHAVFTRVAMALGVVALFLIAGFAIPAYLRSTAGKPISSLPTPGVATGEGAPALPNWQKVMWSDTELLGLSGQKAKRLDGGILIPAATTLHLPKRFQVHNYVLKCRAHGPASDPGTLASPKLYFTLLSDTKVANHCLLKRDSGTVEIYALGKPVFEKALPPSVLGAIESELEFAVLDETLAVRCNGVYMGQVSAPGISDHHNAVLMALSNKDTWFKDVQLLDLSGVADPLKALGWEASAGEASKAVAQTPPVRRLTWKKAAWSPDVREEFMKSEGWLRNERRFITSEDWDEPVLLKESAMRMKLRWEGDTGSFVMGLRRQNDVRIEAVIDESMNFKLRRFEPPSKGKTVDLEVVKLSRVFVPGDEAILEVAAIGEKFYARLNGRTIQATDPLAPKSGAMSFGGKNALYGEVEYVNLDGVPDPLKALGWEAPEPSTPVAAGELQVPIPAWLQQARKDGGRLEFYRTPEVPAEYDALFDPGGAAQFDDFVELFHGPYSWAALRRNGELWGKTWGAHYENIASFGPIQSKSIVRGHSFTVVDVNKNVLMFPGSVVAKPGMSGLARAIGFEMSAGRTEVLLNETGHTLQVRNNQPKVSPPPPGFFENANAIAVTTRSFLAAEAGKPTRVWDGVTGQLVELGKEMTDVVEADGNGSEFVLLRTTGEVVVLHSVTGVINPKDISPPVDLGPAVRVRAGARFLAQRPDGTWVTWVNSTLTRQGNVNELNSIIQNMGPAIDMETGSIELSGGIFKGRYVIAIKPGNLSSKANPRGREQASHTAPVGDTAKTSHTPQPPPSTTERPGSSGSLPATKDKPFENTLGMRFVPVPGTNVLFSIWETRVKDYAAYAAVRNVNNTWTTQEKNGVPISREPEYPVVGVNWDDAQAFCQWLTEKESAAGKLPKGAKYRLPTDGEWSGAVGLPPESGATPAEKSRKNGVDFPWGLDFPPKARAGNYADTSFHEKFPNDTVKWMEGYTDGFATTAPVGSFVPNKYGIYDLSGNVWEWCEDWFDAAQKDRVLRGDSWNFSFDRGYLLSSDRLPLPPTTRTSSYGFRCVLDVPGR